MISPPGPPARERVGSETVRESSNELVAVAGPFALSDLNEVAAVTGAECRSRDGHLSALRIGRPLALNVLVDRPPDLGGETSIICPRYCMELVTNTAIDERMNLCSVSGSVFLHDAQGASRGNVSPPLAEVGTGLGTDLTESQVISAHRTPLGYVAHTWGDLEVSAS